MEESFDKFEKWYKSYRDIFNPDSEIDLRQYLTTEPNRKVSIPQLHYISALISKEAYNDPDDRELTIGKFDIDRRYNTTRTTVYRDYQNTFIIGIRGTANSFIDLLTDSLIAVGKNNLSIRKDRQVKYIKEIIEELESEGYDTNGSIITGHSLGGLLITHVLEEIPAVLGIGFNTGSSPLQSKPLSNYLINRPVLLRAEDQRRFINYLVKGDLISLSSKYLYKDSIEIIPNPPAKNALEAHKISFLIKNIQPFPEL